MCFVCERFSPESIKVYEHATNTNPRRVIYICRWCAKLLSKQADADDFDNAFLRVI